MLRIAVIIGSTRPGRNGEAVAKWVYEIAQKRSDAEFELVDIRDFNLPLLDEPVPCQHTRARYTNARPSSSLALAYSIISLCCGSSNALVLEVYHYVSK